MEGVHDAVRERKRFIRRQFNVDDFCHHDYCRIRFVGARRLPRIKRATFKRRNPRPGLALCMLSQTVVAAATSVTGSAAVPVTLVAVPVPYPRRVVTRVSGSVGGVAISALHFVAARDYCSLVTKRANELIAEGDGYTFIAAPRSPDLRHTSKRRRHLCYCGNE
jgi:hypothetical protein